VATTSKGLTGDLLLDVRLGIILRVEVALIRDLLVNVGLSLYLGNNVGLGGWGCGLSRNASRGTHSQCKKGNLNV
jgi:hypothetical protein